ncbi:Ankyrin Repeat Domain-Containing Protein 11 [Manis pentadactyla]|nr:Ankyrin Repeat Domain-Containing Protein 11 [Manis pentadactyla]
MHLFSRHHSRALEASCPVLPLAGDGHSPAEGTGGRSCLPLYPRCLPSRPRLGAGRQDSAGKRQATPTWIPRPPPLVCWPGDEKELLFLDKPAVLGDTYTALDLGWHRGAGELDISIE